MFKNNQNQNKITLFFFIFFFIVNKISLKFLLKYLRLVVFCAKLSPCNYDPPCNSDSRAILTLCAK